MVASGITLSTTLQHEVCRNRPNPAHCSACPPVQRTACIENRLCSQKGRNWIKSQYHGAVRQPLRVIVHFPVAMLNVEVMRRFKQLGVQALFPGIVNNIDHFLFVE